MERLIVRPLKPLLPSVFVRIDYSGRELRNSPETQPFPFLMSGRGSQAVVPDFAGRATAKAPANDRELRV